MRLRFAVVLLIAACSSSPAPDVDPFAEIGVPVAAQDGGWSAGPFRAYRGGQGAYAEPFAYRTMTPAVQFLLGFYGFAESGGEWQPAAVSGRSAGGLALGAGTATLTPVKPGVVRLDVAAPAGHNRVTAAFACDPDDRFLGFGAQTDALEHRGHRVPIWVSEEGIGKDHDLPEETLSLIGHMHDSYFPVPFFVSPKGHGVLALGTSRMVFELCSETSDAWRVETWSGTLSLLLITGDGPMAVLERASEWLGKPPMPPDWALLPWIAAKGGTEVVRQKANAVREAHIPASAIWSEDWLGESIDPFTGNNIKYHWQWDPAHYPDLAAFIGELHEKDLRFLGYFNPFVVKGFPEWEQATKSGYLPKGPDGEDAVFGVLTKQGSVVDLTSAEARAWVVEYMKAGRDLGLDGWMADYGEWIPFDAVFADGRTGAEVSSDYPRLWQDVNREACDGECVFFARSGFTGSAGRAPAFWGGDQNTDFGEEDGLPTAIRMGVGLGLAGVSFYGSDIAGYTSAGVPPSTKELWFRWCEAGALSPIMRTHEGNAGPKNWQLDSDAETTAHFKRYAELHTRLFPLWKALLAEASATGRPVIRHPALHHPEDPAMAVVRDTYLLGDALYVAPVVAAGATERTLVLPPGRWADGWTGERREGPATVTVPAPLDVLPFFAREGAVIPMLPEGVETPSAATKAHDEHLVVRLVLGKAGAFTLADGTTLALTSASAPDPGDLGLPSCSANSRPCSSKDGRVRRLRLAGAELSGAGFGFTASGGPARIWDLELVGE